MKAAHGLVIGKFYPPHTGHHLLVNTAARTCRRVTVIVMASSVESIPLELRVEWMRKVHDDASNVTVVGTIDEHRLDFDDPVAWAAHVQLMREALRPVTSDAVDAVFTSEAYGGELARRFEARHVCLDPERHLANISATAIRANPVSHWHHLAPPVRGWFARRVVLIGAESTGKSTLAPELAQALRSLGGSFAETRYVPEYGRDYAVQKWCMARAKAAIEGRAAPSVNEVDWDTHDFVLIAERQNAREQVAASDGGPVLICDTDSFATSVWHERYLGHRSADVERLAASRTVALYLLTHSEDMPFVQDGTRDGEAIRGWMTGRLETRLRESGLPFAWLRGDRTERREQALAAIDSMISAGWKLAPPLG
ncbi:MAG: AAA family ATPase [Anaerolineae bacterium]|nr:AAA family ATPase [Gemmatimonadaceae bacterium]